MVQGGSEVVQGIRHVVRISLPWREGFNQRPTCQSREATGDQPVACVPVPTQVHVQLSQAPNPHATWHPLGIEILRLCDGSLIGRGMFCRPLFVSLMLRHSQHTWDDWQVSQAIRVSVMNGACQFLAAGSNADILRCCSLISFFLTAMNHSGRCPS